MFSTNAVVEILIKFLNVNFQIIELFQFYLNGFVCFFVFSFCFFLLSLVFLASQPGISVLWYQIDTIKLGTPRNWSKYTALFSRKSFKRRLRHFISMATDWLNFQFSLRNWKTPIAHPSRRCPVCICWMLSDRCNW